MAGLTAIIALTSTPVSARPAMVERLAELQARGSGDRKGLSDSYHHNREVERPSGVVRESTQPPKYVERPAVHHRLAELQSRGHRDRRGVVYDTHKGYEFETQSGVVTENTEHLGYVPREETNIERPAMVERLRRMNRDGRLNERGVL
ncbi:MAG: hypothetical protein AAFY57_11655 [Cyanobacteria bacterium J06642_2]